CCTSKTRRDAKHLGLVSILMSKAHPESVYSNQHEVLSLAQLNTRCFELLGKKRLGSREWSTEGWTFFSFLALSSLELRFFLFFTVHFVHSQST
ncbi:MAG: hypothetical protein AAFR83_24660, partial [Cyanobacteria bacterium J06629_18]